MDPALAVANVVIAIIAKVIKKSDSFAVECGILNITAGTILVLVKIGAKMDGIRFWNIFWLVSGGFLLCVLLVFGWFLVGSLLASGWFLVGFRLVSDLFLLGFGLASNSLLICFWLFSGRFLVGFWLVSDRFRFCF